MNADRLTFIHNLAVGDEVYWADPSENVSSGVYSVVDIDPFPRTEDTIVYIRSEHGSEAEVLMGELS